ETGLVVPPAIYPYRLEVGHQRHEDRVVLIRWRYLSKRFPQLESGSNGNIFPPPLFGDNLRNAGTGVMRGQMRLLGKYRPCRSHGSVAPVTRGGLRRTSCLICAGVAAVAASIVGSFELS